MNKFAFRGRAFVSMLMMFGIVIVALSGYVLYVAPHGRGRFAEGWSFLALEKDDWERLHIVFGVLFPLVAAIHLWLNRKPLAGYLRRKLAESRPCAPRLEPLAALALCLFLGFSALLYFPPGSTLLEFGRWLSRM